MEWSGGSNEGEIVTNMSGNLFPVLFYIICSSQGVDKVGNIYYAICKT